MARLPRCATSGKLSFPTSDDAIASALKTSRIRGLPLRAYECGCGAWHLTKNPGGRRDWAGNLHGFMVARFIPAVRACLAEGGFLKTSEDVIKGGTFLVGYRGRLFAVESDMQVGRVADGFYAVGSGSDIALGSMHTTRDVLDPRKRITLALEAAEHFATGVAGPFTIEAVE